MSNVDRVADETHQEEFLGGSVEEYNDDAHFSANNGRDDGKDDGDDDGIEDGNSNGEDDDNNGIFDEKSSSSDGDGDSSEDEEDDDGLCEYERLRLERIARNNARLAMLGFNDDKGKKAKKRRSAPSQPRKSLIPDGPRRQNPGRERRATTFNESELLIEVGLKRKRRGSSGLRPPHASSSSSHDGGKAAMSSAGRKPRCGKCEGCTRDVDCLSCVACVTGKARCIFRKCQWGGKANDGRADDDDAADVDGGGGEEVDHHDTECYVCQDGGDLICCDGCEKAYHSYCHRPKIWELPDGEWYCMICTNARRALEREDAKTKQPKYSGPLIADLGHGEVNCKIRFPKIECVVCEESEVAGVSRPPDWVTCRECDDSYHGKCLDPPLESNLPWRMWRCITCKTENKKANAENNQKVKKEKVEKESKPLFEGEHMDDCFMCYNGGDLICCDYCEKAYHLECHIPPLTEIPKGLWKCQECAAVEYTRMMKCGECHACVRDDCGRCSNCLDKPKFGGPNKLKQVCSKKKCPYLRFAPPAKVATKKASSGQTKKELKLQFSKSSSSTNKKRKRQNPEGAHDAATTPTKRGSAFVERNTPHDDSISNGTEYDAVEASTKTSGVSFANSRPQDCLTLQSATSNGIDCVQKYSDGVGLSEMNHSLLAQSKTLKRKQGRPSKRRKVEPLSTVVSDETAAELGHGQKHEPTPQLFAVKNSDSQRVSDETAAELGQHVQKHEPTPQFFAVKNSDSQREDIERIINIKSLKNDPLGNKIRLVIVKALTHPQHCKIQDKACEKLRSMVANAENVSQIIHLGGLKMSSKAMRDHPEKPIVQAEASALLAELVWVNPPCITEIIAEGFLSLVLTSMKNHETHHKVQQMGCGFFRAMSYDFANHPYINSVNGVGAIVDSMKRNPKKSDVLKEGCYFLQNMLCNPGILPETIQSITSKGLVSKVVDAMAGAPSEYLEAACGVIANLAISESARSLIGTYTPSLSALLEVLCLTNASENARKCSLTALKLLATGIHCFEAQIIRLGGIQKGMDLLKTSDDVVLVESALKLLAVLTKDNKANALVLADAGGFDLVTSEMSKHPNLPHIQASCCEVLRHLPIENFEQASFVAELIIAAFKKNREDKILQFEGCHVLLQNCCQFEAISKLLQSKRIFTISSNRRRSSSRQKIEQQFDETHQEVQQALTTGNVSIISAGTSLDINSIIRSKPLDDPVANKIRLVIKKALKNPDDSKIQDKACEVLRKWATSDDIASKIINLGGLKMSSKAMRDHSEKPIVQAEASALLAELVWVNPPCITEIIAEGFLSLVLTSMKNHETHHKVQQMGCGFFRAMSYDFANHPYIKSINGVGAIIDSMKRNPKKFDVLKEGCYFLQNMLCNPDILPIVIRSVVSEGIALTIIDSIFDKVDDDEYHGAACGLLANLSLDNDAREHIGSYDSSVSTLLKVFGLGVDVDACKCSLTALKLLATGNDDYKDKIVRLGGIKSVIDLLTPNIIDAVMIDSGLGLLSELTKDNSTFSQLLLDQDGLKFVTKAMSYHSTSSHVQARACEVLCNLPIGPDEVKGAAELILKAMKNRTDSMVQYAGCRALLHCCFRSPAIAELLRSEEVILRRSQYTP